MTIPSFESIMYPLLKLAADGNRHSLNNDIPKLAKFFDLSDEEISIQIPSGQSRFKNRVGWARTFLKKAGLLSYPERGYFQITERGIEVLSKNPITINIDYLKQFPEFLEFRQKTQSDGPELPHEPEIEQTPEEAIESSYLKIRSNLSDELLDLVLHSSPDFFEKLVVELLVAMGYGGTRKEAARAVGKSGDGGIDGIIDEDRLGLDMIYIQAKRWQFESKVSRPNIQAFVGALVGKHATKGVFITTSDFTDEAIKFVKEIGTKVVLINGERLANFMIDYGIGVSTKTEYKIKQIDRDYFEEIVVS